MPRFCRRTSLFLLFLLLSAIVTAAQTRPQPRPGAPITSQRTVTAQRPAAVAEPTYTGVWEAVNYPDDVVLEDTYFVSSRVGWVAGGRTHSKGGFILHTSDGGEHWEVQAGDPQSTDEAINHLRFIDAHNGWAIQNGKLLHTADGSNWLDAGALPKFQPFIDYAFTDPSTGHLLAGYANNASIFRTDDGGKSWKPVFKCAARIQDKGLTKDVGCHLNSVYFVSQNVGIAVGGGFNGGLNVVARTDDGGASWRLIFVSTEIEDAHSVFLTSEKSGVMRTRGNKLYYTSDGGQTWTGLLGTAGAELRFADPEVGWSCSSRTCAFTLDGGQHWTSRQFAFPGQVTGFSSPRRDRVFVVGDHGMIYRYRIVRTDQVTPNMIPAPAMPLFGGPIGTSLDKLHGDISALRRKLAAAGVPTASLSAGADASALFTSSEAEAQAETGATSAMSSTGTGGTVEDASAGDAASAQDTSPPSAALQACCASEVQALQSDFAQFTQAAPTVGSKFRNLNLLIVGLNMAADLLNKAKGIKDGIIAFKHAPNLPAAANLLQGLASKVDSTRNSFINGFNDINASGSAGSFGSAVGGAISGAPLPADTPSTPAAASGSGGTQGVASATDQRSKPSPQKKDDNIQKKLKGLGLKFPR